jgi:dTDP-4-dehydrorhamnose reductase
MAMRGNSSTDPRPVAVVTGAAGQLGSAICEGLTGVYDVVPLPRALLDVTDSAAVADRVAAARPAVIVNCVAYNDVDGAQDAPERALDVNALAVRSLARAAERADAIFVHYSTDFVFDGETDRPYTEDDAPSPQSVYGQSKLVGEWMAASTPRHYVLRVESLFGGPHARSSVDRIIEALGEQREARVFHDRDVSPSFVEDVVAATRYLIQQQPADGVYHCVNTGHATWLNLAREIQHLLGTASGRLVPVSMADVTLKAPRPRYAALDNGKLARAGLTMPTWQDALRRHISRK